jgi:hypothetical protein
LLKLQLELQFGISREEARFKIMEVSLAGA